MYRELIAFRKILVVNTSESSLSKIGENIKFDCAESIILFSGVFFYIMKVEKGMERSLS